MINLIFALLLVQGQDPKAREKATQDQKLQDKLDDLQDELDSLRKKMEQMEKRQAATTSANPFTVLNPTLTVAADFLLRVDDRKVYLDNDPTKDRIDDTINLREVELDLRASVDPYVDGVAIVSFGAEVPGQFGVDIEEFYATVKSLPIPLWETPPLGTQIKVGRFRTEFGLNNISHTHDLPQTDRPLVIQEFLSEDGSAANGISSRSRLPSLEGTALNLTLQWLQGGGISIADDPNHWAYLSNLNFFWQMADEHSLNLAFIGFYGTNDPEGHDQSRTASAEFLYKWKPLRQGEYNSFLFGGQVFYAKHEFPTGPDTHERTWPLGYDVWAQYQVSSRLYAGIRWDWTETLVDTSLKRKQLSPYFTWYTSEFFRARFTYQHVWSDLPIEDHRHTFLMELVVVFGAHPPEPFWVNK